MTSCCECDDELPGSIKCGECHHGSCGSVSEIITNINNNNNNNKGEWNMCYVEAKDSTSDPDNKSSTGVIPKSLSHSLTRLNKHPNTYACIHKCKNL